ncbi:MAG: MFS transporter [Chloroflexi bacterium]|nr:MFS transporter [Chloroflexota bacterium]
MKGRVQPAGVLTPLGVAICCSLFGDLTLYAVLATQREVVGISLAAVGIMLGANRLIRIPGNPVAGMLIGRWGRRRAFIVGMALGVLAVASFGLANGFLPFLLGRLAWGVAWALINVSGLAMVLDVSTPANRGRLAGLYNAPMWLGFAGGPLVGGFLVDAWGFRAAMLACAGIAAFGLGVALLWLPETATLGQGPGPRDGPASPASLRLQLSARTRLRHRWEAVAPFGTVLCLILVTKFVNEGSVLSTLGMLLEQKVGATLTIKGFTLGLASVSGLALALRSALAGASGPLAGQLADVWLGRGWTIGLALVAGALGLGVLFWATSPVAIVAGICLNALSDGALLASLAAELGDRIPTARRGPALGAFATAGDIGSTAGPFLSFALLPLAPVRWVYLICAGVLLVAVVIVWRRPVALGRMLADEV